MGDSIIQGSKVTFGGPLFVGHLVQTPMETIWNIIWKITYDFDFLELEQNYMSCLLLFSLLALDGVNSAGIKKRLVQLHVMWLLIFENHLLLWQPRNSSAVAKHFQIWMCKQDIEYLKLLVGCATTTYPAHLSIRFRSPCL